ncbi:MAG: hypothetical protein HYU97_09020 [Deltaproteobacteria bacterium]|nr:hypothetical protein [Deltaproteobacteria bacterium]
MHQILKELCVEVLSGDIGTERFNRLWVQSGIPLEGEIFDIANNILNHAAEITPELILYQPTYH